MPIADVVHNPAETQRLVASDMGFVQIQIALHAVPEAVRAMKFVVAFNQRSDTRKKLIDVFMRVSLLKAV